MRSLITKIFITGLVIILYLISPVDLKSREITAKITKTNDFVVCSKINDKSVVLIIDIGNVLKSDSLYACNFEIEYIPEVVRYGGMLSSSTLIGDNTDFSAVGDSAARVIRGYIYDNYPLFGNKPLFALRIDLRDTCYFDSIPFKLKYIEFTDEYQNNVSKYEDIKVAVIQNDKHNLKSEIKQDTMFFENKKITVPVVISEKNFKNITDFQLTIKGIDTDKFVLENIIANNELQFVSKENDDDKTYINFLKSKLLTEDTYINLEFKSLNDSIEIESKIIVKSYLNDKCSCNLTSIIDSVVFKQYAKKDTSDTSSVYLENEITKFNFFNNYLSIENQDAIKEIELVDLTGKVIEIFEVNNDKFYIDLLNRYSIGVYILVINTELNKFRKKIFINN